MNRGHFATRIGFVAAAAGSAVGLGNIWRFPYETGANGGAAFLMIYLVCIFLIGFPVMVAEISIGRAAQLNTFGSFKKFGGRAWGLAGIFGIICAVMILSFYNVVAGWAFGYFTKFISGQMIDQTDMGQVFGGHVTDIPRNLLYSSLFMIATAWVVSKGIKDGIEAFSKIMMPTLLIMLVLLIGYALTLDNAMAGVSFYLNPDFSKISGSTIYSAMGQAFFSLSLGLGGLITYGSYLTQKENIISSSIIVTITDTTVAFLAGLLIFPLVFSQGMEPTAGPGLVFIAIPAIFTSMGPIVGTILGSSFFLLLCFAALTSTISMLEIPVAYFVDELKWKRSKSVVAIVIGIFALSIPSMLSQGYSDFFTNFLFYEGKDQDFLSVVADLFSEVALPLGGTIITLFAAYKWRTLNMNEEIKQGNPGYIGSVMASFINVMVSYVCPIILSVIFIVTVLEKYFGITII